MKSPRCKDLAGAAVASALALGYFWVAWSRHRNYWSGAFDLGIFDQAAWQLGHGRDYISLVDRRVLADHFSPILYPIALLYRVAPSPGWLLAIQSIALASTILPLRGMARDLSISPWIPTGLVIASAPLLSASVFDFHPAALAVPFIAWAVRCATIDNHMGLVVATFGVILCRADLGITLVAVAIVARGSRSRNILLVLGSASMMLGAIGPAWFGPTNGWAPHFGHLGAGPLDAAIHPSRVVASLISSSALDPLMAWTAAGGALIILRPRWLVAVLVAGAPILLSRWPGTALPWFHYGAPVAPLVIGGSLVALASTSIRHKAVRMVAGVVMTLTPAMILLAASPLSPNAPARVHIPTVLHLDSNRDAAAALAHVKPGDAVSAEHTLIPHLSQREQVYAFPLPFRPASGVFAPGSEPDLTQYGPDVIDVVVVSVDEDLAGLEHFEVVAEVRGYQILRPSVERITSR